MTDPLERAAEQYSRTVWQGHAPPGERERVASYYLAGNANGYERGLADGAKRERERTLAAIAALVDGEYFSPGEAREVSALERLREVIEMAKS